MNASVTPFERNKLFRDHSFFPSDLESIPALYETESVPIPEKIIHQHYFLGQGNHWFVAEFDPRTGDAFGYAILGNDLQNAEWGYVNLHELERAFFDRHTTDFRVVLRQTDWVPRSFKDVELPE